jgi:hypothetical protein
MPSKQILDRNDLNKITCALPDVTYLVSMYTVVLQIIEKKFFTNLSRKIKKFQA